MTGRAHPEQERNALTAADIRFVTRNVTETDVAAITAVLSAVARVQADAHRQAQPERYRDAWARSQNSLRATSFTPGEKLWRTFSG